MPATRSSASVAVAPTPSQDPADHTHARQKSPADASAPGGGSAVGLQGGLVAPAPVLGKRKASSSDGARPSSSSTTAAASSTAAPSATAEYIGPSTYDTPGAGRSRPNGSADATAHQTPSFSQPHHQPLRLSPQPPPDAHPPPQRRASHGVAAQQSPNSLAGFPRFSPPTRHAPAGMAGIDVMMVDGDHDGPSSGGAGAFGMLGMPPRPHHHEQPFAHPLPQPLAGPPHYTSTHPRANSVAPAASPFFGSTHMGHPPPSPLMAPPAPSSSAQMRSISLSQASPGFGQSGPTLMNGIHARAGPPYASPVEGVHSQPMNGVPQGGRDSANSNGNGNGNVNKMDAASEGKEGTDPPRTGRACLACRKLKTRCDGAEDPPCRRCRQGGHECIFVESKRGKRPAKKHASGDLVEKFKQVEQTLNMVIQSINSGQPPDAATVQHLHRMQQSLASDPQVHGGANGSVDPSATTTSATPSAAGTARFAPQSPGSVTSSSNGTALPLPGSGVGDAPHQAMRRGPFSSTPNANNGGSASAKKELERRASSQPGVSAGAGLNLLADASLAAELDGSRGITGLDPTFNLSKVTEALEQPANSDSPPSLSTPSDKRSPQPGGGPSGPGEGSQMGRLGGGSGGIEDENGPPAPALLTKGIVDADTAVELFRVFFDYCYIHLPLLDPAQNSATAVCARSPFLFTVICAIASRFHPNRDLDPACYDEAHACFMQTIVTGERSIESVQACMLLTVWTAAPKAAVDDRPQQAWLYHGMAVRMAMELGLFRPPAFSELVPMRNGWPQGGFPWSALKEVPEEKQREALNRERTWLLLFVIDRYMAAVTGRPYQVHDAKPFLIPTHPLSLPFDLGIIAHQELQAVVGQVMDTFRDRIYGFAAASNEMPSPVVMKLFNGRMDEWRQRWCPKSGEPISNNLLFYWYNSKLFLNTFPLQTMLRNGEAADDPECVSTCINSAKEIFDLVHKYAELGVLRHCPDFNLLVLLYAAVFLLKVRVSESRFSQLISGEELIRLMRQAIDDCSSAMMSERHATGTVARMFRALLATYHKMNSGGGVGVSRHPSQHGHSRRDSAVDFSAYMHSVQNSPKANMHHPSSAATSSSNTAPAVTAIGPDGGASASTSGTFNAETSASIAPHATNAAMSGLSPTHPDMLDQGGLRLGGLSSQGMFSGLNTPAPFYGGASRPHTPGDPLESFLSDTHFYDSMLVSQGSDGFFAWQEGLGGLDSAAGMLDLDTFGFPGGQPSAPPPQ